MRRFRAALLALAMFLGLAVFTAPQASASCYYVSTTKVCAKVTNASTSASSLYAYVANAPNSPYVIAKGKSSTQYGIVDVYRFMVPSGCHGTSGSKTFYGGVKYDPGAGVSWTIKVSCP